MDAQSESCETPPLSDPQAPGKIRKAFKLFGKGKPGSGVASIFTRRGKGEGAPKSPLPRSKTLDGLSENATATQDAPETATMSEPTASTQQQQQQEGEGANESAQNEQPSSGESKADPTSSPTRPSISSISSAKSLGFLSLLRRGRRCGGGGGGGGEGDRQVCTEAHRGGRQRKGLRSLFGSMRWRRHDGDETDEGAGPPLTASRSNSVEIIKEHLTLTPRPAPRAEGERDLDESTMQSLAPSSLPATPKPSTTKPAGEEKPVTSQLNPNASMAEPTSDRLSTLLGDISSILSFDSLTGCGDIVADVEAEWAKASSRVGASATATKDRSDDTDSGEKSGSLSSSATPSGKLSPAPATTTPTPLTISKPVAAPVSSPPAFIATATKPASPAAAPTPSPPPFASFRTPTTPVPVPSPSPSPSPALSVSSLSASPSISKPEPKPSPTALPVPTPAPVPAPVPAPTPTAITTTPQTAPAAPKPSAAAAAAPAPKSAPPAAPGAKFTTGQMTGGKQTTVSGKPPPKIVTTFGLSCNRIRTSPPTKPASDAKPPTPTTKSAPVSTFSDFTVSAATASAVTEPAPSAKAPVTPAVAFTISAAAPIPSAPAAYKPPPSYTTAPVLTTSHPVSAVPKPAPPLITIPPAAVPSTRPPPVASPVSPPSPLPPFSPPPAVSPPLEEARVDGGEDLASREALRETPSQKAAPPRREEPPVGLQEQTPVPAVAGGPGALGAKRSPVVKPATLSKIPVSGGGRPPASAVRQSQIPMREAHSNGDAAPAMSWGPPTPVGSEEDVLHPLSRDTGSRDTLSEFAGQSPATSPPTSPHAFNDDRVPQTPSPPGASASRLPSKIGVPSGIPRDSKIPIKRDTPVAPVYHSLQGKGDAPRTKIPVSKVPVRRGGHTAVRK